MNGAKVGKCQIWQTGIKNYKKLLNLASSIYAEY